MEDLIALHMEDYYSGVCKASVSPTENTTQGKILYHWVSPNSPKCSSYFYYEKMKKKKKLKSSIKSEKPKYWASNTP